MKLLKSQLVNTSLCFNRNPFKHIFSYSSKDIRHIKKHEKIQICNLIPIIRKNTIIEREEARSKILEIYH